MNLPRIREMLRKHEGLELKPYKDSEGKWTIGIGRNLDDIGISPDEAYYMLENDIKRSVDEANRFTWFAALNEARQEVIVQMIFNLGLPRFLGFRKMLAAMHEGYIHVAAEEMLNSLWARQVGSRATELALILETGEYPE